VLRILIDARALVALTLAAAAGLWGTQTYPVPRDDVFLGLIAERAPDVYRVLAHRYDARRFADRGRRSRH
jgi:hypothetical protein